jgi:hypothetical protein
MVDGHFALDEGYHGVASTEGEESDFEECPKELQKDHGNGELRIENWELGILV